MNCYWIIILSNFRFSENVSPDAISDGPTAKKHAGDKKLLDKKKKDKKRVLKRLWLDLRLSLQIPVYICHRLTEFYTAEYVCSWNKTPHISGSFKHRTYSCLHPLMASKCMCSKAADCNVCDFGVKLHTFDDRF